LACHVKPKKLIGKTESGDRKKFKNFERWRV